MVARGDFDSSGDEDYGPVAPPRPISPPLDGKSRRGSGRKMPKPTEKGSPPNGGGIRKAAGISSPGYGSTSTMTSPRGMNARSTAPPPLDLGEASYEENPPLTQRSGLGQGTIIPDIPERQEPNSPAQSEESRDRTSEDVAETSDSTRPLTSRAISRAKPSPKIGKSPRFLTSASPKIAPSLRQLAGPAAGRKSIRKSEPRRVGESIR